MKVREEEKQVEPIDEDEQDEVVNETIIDFKQQTKQMSNVLNKLFLCAAAASIVSKLFHSPDSGSDEYDYHHPQYKKLIVSTYPFYSCFAHIVAAKIIQKSTYKIIVGEGITTGTNRVVKQEGDIGAVNSSCFSKEEIVSLIGILMSISQLSIFFKFGMFDAHVWSLAATNLMTMAASSFFIFDMKWTILSIQDLKKHKYKFKTL